MSQLPVYMTVLVIFALHYLLRYTTFLFSEILKVNLVLKMLIFCADDVAVLHSSWLFNECADERLA